MILAVIWPNTALASIAGVFGGVILIRFSATRFKGEREMQIFDKLALAGGVILIVLALVRLVLLILTAVGVIGHFWIF